MILEKDGLKKIMIKQYCVIFDMDGVLADTGPIHLKSWIMIANELGIKITKKFFKETFGQQSIPIMRKLAGPNINQLEIEKFASLKEKYYRDMVKDEIKPLPGVITLIKLLKEKKFKLAIGSSGPPENIDLLLNGLKIKQYFDVIISAKDVKKGKPAPDVFLIAAKRLNIAPKRCLVIEDAPVGLEAAMRAGMKSIALTTTHNKDELSNANFVCPDLSYLNVNHITELLNIKYKKN